MTDNRPNPRPSVSVVIPAFDASGTLRACLDGVAGQTVPPDEVILVDGSADPEPARRIAAEYDFVQFHSADPALGAHEKRNIGATMAHGDILVFTDPDCVGDPSWLEELIGAHGAGHRAVAGAVASLRDGRNRSMHMVKYPWWLPGSPAGPCPEAASANTSVTREAWETVGPYATDRWAADSELSWRMDSAGIEIWFQPRAVVTHLDHGAWDGFFQVRFERGYDYGLTRARARGWRAGERWLRVSAMPLVPLVMTARAAGFARRAGRMGDWCGTVPVQLLANLCWAAGEARALLRTME